MSLPDQKCLRCDKPGEFKDRRLYCTLCKNAADRARREKRTQKVIAAAGERVEVTASPKGYKSVIILCDVHVPEQDTKTWRAMLRWLRTHQPDEGILLGDFAELESCSQHSSYTRARFEEDMVAVRAAIQELQAASPRTSWTYAEGNHETRLPRLISAKVPALEDAISIPEALGLAEMGIRWVPTHEQPIRKGKLDAYHGHQIFTGGSSPIYPSGKINTTRGYPGRIVVCGHLHRFQWVETKNHHGNSIGVTLPAVRSLDPDWLLEGKAAGWVNGFAVAYIRPNGNVDLHVAKMQDGGFVWPDGRYYSGEVD